MSYKENISLNNKETSMYVIDPLLVELLKLPATPHPYENIMADFILDALKKRDVEFTVLNYNTNKQDTVYRNILVTIPTASNDKSNSMFTAHMDMVSYNEFNTMTTDKRDLVINNRFISNKNKNTLGADDRAGIFILLKMIENKVPGLYLFPFGEEVGGIGSNQFLDSEHKNLLEGINKCVSFDRRGYSSIITHQGSSQTASDEFALELSDQFMKHNIYMVPDDTGIFTDSAKFIYNISECTNISVGYFDEHTAIERLDFIFLQHLTNACINIEWEKLNTYREISTKQDIIYTSPYKKFNRYNNWHEEEQYLFDEEIEMYNEEEDMQEMRKEIDRGLKILNQKYRNKYIVYERYKQLSNQYIDELQPIWLLDMPVLKGASESIAKEFTLSMKDENFVERKDNGYYPETILYESEKRVIAIANVSDIVSDVRDFFGMQTETTIYNLVYLLNICDVDFTYEDIKLVFSYYSPF